MMQSFELESKGKTPGNRRNNRNQESWSRKVMIGLGLWFVVWLVYVTFSNNDGDVDTMDSSRSSSSGKKTKGKKATQKIVPGVAFPPMLDFINNSAGVLYPEHYPDCLFLLKQTIDPQTNRTRYVLEQSMNDYWKHVVGFRRIQLKFNLGILVDMVETLNMDAPLNTQLDDHRMADSTSLEHGLLHRRIYEAGGSIPFYAHWKVLHEDPNICKNPLSFPIFRRAMPMECATNFSYWTIPTAPIIRQIKKVNWGHLMEHMVPRVKQQNKVVVATTAAEAKLPSNEMDMLREKGTAGLAGKLQFLETSKILAKGDDWKPERSELYVLYSGVLDVDHTSNLYPSLLCQTSVLLKRHPSSFIDLFSSTLQPWVHYVPVKPDLSDVEEQVNYVLDEANEAKMEEIVANANDWCRKHMTMPYLKSRIMESLTEFVRRLDIQDKTWTEQWRDHHEKYLVGHWMRQPGGDSWSLPVSIVGGIKNGLRADDPDIETIWNQRREQFR